jgi:hypothetical protein
MAITAEQLTQAAEIVSQADSVRAAATTLRERLSPLKALVLDAFDMRGEAPAVHVPMTQGPERALYMMSTDGHCWSVTRDPLQASALVLTQG